MDIHYNAFISYRHHPDDIRVAQEIHRRLERFPVPGALRKKTGRINRLFRDKDELPITSNLTDTITQALANSDYLIVICSVHTKESIWVQREIETFLRTHSRDRVLTVLASGEPQDTIPEILQWEETVDPETGAVTRTPIEPLSCDWRIPHRKALREELPRLAAALLHCGYDELRQRQRQYKTRRMVTCFCAALAAMLCLTGYFIYNSIEMERANRQIQANYLQSLRNQSQYLASASQQRLDAGDRLTAIALALEALPQQADQRPYLPQAELALSSALGLYNPDSKIVATGTYGTDVLISDFAISQDSKTLYLLDERNELTIWDVEDFHQVASGQFECIDSNQLFTTVNGDLLLSGFSQLQCCNQDGQLLWEVESCQDVAFLENGTVLVLSKDPSSRILYLDPATGKEILPALELDAATYYSHFCQRTYAADTPLLMQQYVDYGISDVYLVSPEDGSATFLLRPEHTVWCARYIDGKSILVQSDGSGMYNGSYGDMFTTSPAGCDVFCFDSAGNRLWQNKIVSYTYSAANTIHPIPDTDILLIQNGSTFLQLNIQTGETLAQCQCAATPLLVQATEEGLIGILNNGDFFQYQYESNMCNAINYMPANLYQAELNGGLFSRGALDTYVTAYWTQTDDGWNPYRTDALPSTTNSKAVWGDYLAMADYNNLTCYDMRQGVQLWSSPVEYLHELLGFSTDGKTVYLLDAGAGVLALDVLSGAQTSIAPPAQCESLFIHFINGSDFLFGEDSAYFLQPSETGMLVIRQDLKTGRSDHLEIGPGYPQQTVMLRATAEALWLWADETLYLVDFAGGSVHTLAGELPSVGTSYLDKETGTLAVSAGKQILLFDRYGENLLELSMDVQALSLYLTEEHLLVMGDDGPVYRFDRQGTLQQKISLSLYDTYLSSATYNTEDPLLFSWWETEDGDLIFNAAGMGNIIDWENGYCRASIPNFITYYPAGDSLVCCTTKQLGAFPRYTTQDAIARATETLGNFTLTDDQRKAYGLADEP